MILLGLAFGSAVGVAFLVAGNVPLGLLFVIGSLVAAAATVGAIRYSRRGRPGTPSRRGESTGRVLYPSPSQPDVPAAADESWSWTGGANLVGRFGRTNASFPSAVLTLTSGRATMRFRPRVITALFGLHSTTWQPDEVIVVYPVRGRLVSLNRGIAFESSIHPLVYFGALPRASRASLLKRWV